MMEICGQPICTDYLFVSSTVLDAGFRYVTTKCNACYNREYFSGHNGNIYLEI